MPRPLPRGRIVGIVFVCGDVEGLENGEGRVGPFGAELRRPFETVYYRVLSGIVVDAFKLGVGVGRQDHVDNQAGDTLHSIASMYAAHWLEIFDVNPLLRGDPDAIRPGNLINVGVTLRVVRGQQIEALARHLRVSSSGLRLLKPRK